MTAQWGCYPGPEPTEPAADHVAEENRPYVVCPRCKGNGSIGNPAFDGMTGDDIAEMGEEGYEFLAEYTTRGGIYDVPCPECKGQRVVRAECICTNCEQDRTDRAEAEAEAAAERRMGC